MDFRLPEEVISEIQSWADRDGCPHDSMMRDLLLRGFVVEQRRRRRSFWKANRQETAARLRAEAGQ